MSTKYNLPPYIRAALFIVGLYFLVSMLYLAQAILLPLIYATITAVLLSPAVNFLVKKKLYRGLAISIVMIIAILIACGFIILLSSQVRHFGHALPKLMDKFQEVSNQAIIWAAGCFHINADRIDTWLVNEKGELTKNSNAVIGMTLISASSIVQAVILTPVYIFMILLYQPHLLAFAHQIFGLDNDQKVSEILTETKTIIKGYIVGLFGEFIIIAILNSIGLLVLRIDYAILLGILGAALNVIPIIGGIVCIILFIVIALLTKSAIYVLYVLGLYAIIQFIDDHYIFPKIVGSKVKLNLLISIIAVILGDALWGIPGMFLAIPLMAIVKVILDRIDQLKPWGFLLGDTVQGPGKMTFKFTVKGFIQSITSKNTNAR